MKKTKDANIINLFFSDISRNSTEIEFKAFANEEALPKDHLANLNKRPRAYYIYAVPDQSSACDIITFSPYHKTIKKMRVIEREPGKFFYSLKGEGKDDPCTMRANSIWNVLDLLQVDFNYNLASINGSLVIL